ncbi:MAG: DNA primase [Synergistales bacterium]|nr:DNA primase [Synergistales bacterium]
MQDDAVRSVKERLDIVDVIGDYVALRKVGSNYRGLCPFHSEKTPSFYVSPERGSYHCFGCGAGGDLISFVMEMEGLSFVEAMELLAPRAGVTFRREGGKGGKTDAYQLLTLANRFFSENLTGKTGLPARRYLERRGIDATTARSFELGWAGESWDGLCRFLDRQGVPTRAALESGLVLEGRNGLYDRFRGRIIFPIHDVSGRVVAFGGRLVGGDGAKYINSPENELFRKRRSLYLIHKAKQGMREAGRAILVEGYTDAIRLHMHGFTNAVATLGTSLTEGQADILTRFASQCLICYDADAAGEEATLRGMYLLQSRGLDVRVVSLPEGSDPDDLLREEGGKETFQEAQRSALPLLNYHLKLRSPALQDQARRPAAAREILEKMAELPDIDTAPYLPEVASGLGLFAHQVQQTVEEYRKGRKPRAGNRPSGDVSSSAEGMQIEAEQQETPDSLESALVYLLWNGRGSGEIPPTAQVLPLLENELLAHIAAALLQGESPEELESRWLITGDRRPLRALALGAAMCDRFEESGNTLRVVLESLQRKKQQKRYLEVQERFRRGSATPEDLSLLKELGRELKGGHRHR